jgi:hypothetical protein
MFKPGWIYTMSRRDGSREDSPRTRDGFANARDGRATQTGITEKKNAG